MSAASAAASQLTTTAGRSEQIALIGQSVCVAGEVRPAVQLVDLFILQAYRSAQLVGKLYKEVEKFCAKRGIRYILALPYDKSVLLNARFLKLSPLVSLPIRAGVLLRRPAPMAISHSGLLGTMTREQAIELFSSFNSASSENGSRWDVETLFNWFDDPTGDYAVHSTKNLRLVSSLRKTKGVSYTALCAFFARPSAEIAETEVDDLVRTACRLRKLPACVYAATNGPLPKLPDTPCPPDCAGRSCCNCATSAATSTTSASTASS